jgi:prophage regulatory protein
MASFLRLPQVLARVGLRTTRLYELIGDGEFPAPSRLGERAVAWLESEVNTWIEAQARKPRVEIRTRSRSRKKPQVSPASRPGEPQAA